MELLYQKLELFLSPHRYLVEYWVYFNVIYVAVQRNVPASLHLFSPPSSRVYSCTVWSPYMDQEGYIACWNGPMPCCTICSTKLSSPGQTSVSSMLQELEWDTLEKRWQAASLVLMYKIHSETIAINPAYYITPRTPAVTWNYLPYQYQIIPARIQLYQNSFFPRTIIWWNALPVSVVRSSGKQ